MEATASFPEGCEWVGCKKAVSAVEVKVLHEHRCCDCCGVVLAGMIVSIFFLGELVGEQSYCK